jgi:NAD(P)-dependent dehydrogenase (short-subunit alcohol dehydrogenase family)
MKDFRDRVAAITGASSGIGRSLGLELARRGAHLALSDVDEAGLAETALRAKRAGVEVTTARVDVADRAAVEAWADQVVADHGRVNLIANNAGVAVGASVEGTSYEDFTWLMDINFWGVVHGTKAFLPHLRTAGEGHVVNISSIFGLMGIPMQSAYNSAKFAVRGFTEALRIELDIENCGVSATSIHPGGIKTNIARNARMGEGLDGMDASPDEARREFEKLFITSPDKAARQIVRAVQLDKRRALIGPDAKAVDVLSHLPVGLHQRLVARGASRGL